MKESKKKYQKMYYSYDTITNISKGYYHVIITKRLRRTETKNRNFTRKEIVQ